MLKGVEIGRWKMLVKTKKERYNGKNIWERGKQMKNLYGSIVIKKQLKEKGQEIQEHVNYYKLKNKKYGLEIVKENEEKQKIEITNVRDITDDEQKINDVLNFLVIKEVMPDAPDIIEDLVKQYI